MMNISQSEATHSLMDLLHAAESGRLSIVQQIVSKEKSLVRKCRHKNGNNRAFNFNGSAIHYACRSGHLNIVKYLLEQDPTIINDVDCELWTPLHYACNNGHLNIVKLLMEYQADVNRKDSYLSQTPIEFAVYKQFDDIIHFLDPKIEWKRRNAEDIAKQGNVGVFRKKSKCFLARYVLNEEQIRQIEQFRNDPQADDIELTNIEDTELDNLNVRIILSHDFQKHINQTLELTSTGDADDRFLRSSTTSTNEHLMVFETILDKENQINPDDFLFHSRSILSRSLSNVA